MGNDTRESRVRLATAMIALVSALLALGAAFLTAPVQGLLPGRHDEQSVGVGRASGDNSSIRTLQDVLNDINSRPLIQQAMTAKQYAGLRITGETLWLHNITEESDNDTFHLTLLMDANQHGPDLSSGRVVCAVARSSYPALIGARKGLRLYVSGKIHEVKGQQVELTCVSLAFPGGIT
jgi:hypothetical protein